MDNKEKLTIEELGIELFRDCYTVAHGFANKIVDEAKRFGLKKIAKKIHPGILKHELLIYLMWVTDMFVITEEEFKPAITIMHREYMSFCQKQGLTVEQAKEEAAMINDRFKEYAETFNFEDWKNQALFTSIFLKNVLRQENLVLEGFTFQFYLLDEIEFLLKNSEQYKSKIIIK